MPWNEEGGGGGPWGSGGGNGDKGRGRNPWGGNGGKGRRPHGEEPHDLEDIIRRSQDRLKNMPGGLGGGGALFFLLLLVVGIWLGSGFYRVQQDERGVVLRFGEYVGELAQPGLNYHLPWPIETALTPKVTRIQPVEIGFRSVVGRSSMSDNEKRDFPQESLMITGDENIVDIDFVVQWRIDDARVMDYLFNIRDPEETIRRVAESVMREVIGQRGIQAVIITDRDSISEEVKNQMQAILDDYGAGVVVVEVNLEDVAPPVGRTVMADGSQANVIDAFNDVQRAATDNEREQNEARRYRNQILEEVSGQANRLLAQAEAYAAQVTELARGESERFESVLEAYHQAPNVTSQRLYLETLEEVLQNSNMIVIDPETGAGGSGVVPYLPLNELQRPAAQQQRNAQ